jgi:hypothetical protein|tara:strand:+ start:1631 stop:2500 length:870 start_codon:yes stop_codon:yes gene_type:complete
MSNQSNQSNPLSAYFRAPKLYLDLPSGAKFYSDDIVDVPESGEFAIYPMTTKDELMLKNPDALLNGEAVANLVKSCVPEIKKPKLLFSADVDAILIAIRGASGGDEVTVNAECPECKELSTVVVSIDNSLSTMERLENEYVKELPNGLTVVSLPFTYGSTIKAGLASFQSTRSMQAISELTDDMERLKAFNTSFVKLADLNFEMIIDSIKEIRYTDGDGEVGIVSDPKQIRQFLENTDNVTGKSIEEFTNEINSKGIKQEVRVACQNEKCENTFEAPINFDPVNFFTGS